METVTLARSAYEFHDWVVKACPGMTCRWSGCATTGPRPKSRMGSTTGGPGAWSGAGAGPARHVHAARAGALPVRTRCTTSSSPAPTATRSRRGTSSRPAAKTPSVVVKFIGYGGGRGARPSICCCQRSGTGARHGQPRAGRALDLRRHRGWRERAGKLARS